jgi:hypothetical protein
MGLGCTTTSIPGKRLAASAHCAGVRATRKSGGVLPSLITPIFLISITSSFFAGGKCRYRRKASGREVHAADRSDVDHAWAQKPGKKQGACRYGHAPFARERLRSNFGDRPSDP